MSSLVHILANHSVKWFTDNQGVAKILYKGSMNSDLQDLAVEIFRLCMKHCIYLTVEWLPWHENSRADYLSKTVERDDWGISFEVSNTILQRWGQLDVDWFAPEHNA